MLLNRWSRSIDREHPLSEYPRPQFVRDSYISLNGTWKFVIKKSSSLPMRFMADITVPFSPETEISGVCRFVKPDDFLFYQKKFTLPDDFNKGRVFVNFGAVDQIATVYLNRKKVGSHKGGYTPFRCELTDYLVEGENELLVAVQDFSDTRAYSRGKQKIDRGGIWYTAQSGIWQSVWLESTPVEFLDRVKITPDYDNDQVSFEYFGTDRVEVMIYDGDELVADTTDKTVKIPDFKPWSPESPFLYNVVFKACGESIFAVDL